jgi:1-acyl-sn-glycerol-3-phosphate acyltransferase
LKKVLARIFAAWALVVFVNSLLPVALLMWVIGLVKEPRRTHIFSGISKVWMRFFFFASGCGLRVYGKEHFVPGENYIVVCNHNSLMDVPVSTPFIPGANKTIAKAEMAKIPVFGLVYKRGAVLVNRNDKNSRRDSFRKMKEVLGLGMHMCIYPEGTRNRTTMPLKEFHDGAFKLAIDCGKRIVPALIVNTKKILPPGKAFYFWPGRMELHFMPPVDINPGDDLETLKGTLHKIMTDFYVAHVKEG